jgi:hypothetical protein
MPRRSSKRSKARFSSFSLVADSMSSLRGSAQLQLMYELAIGESEVSPIKIDGNFVETLQGAVTAWDRSRAAQ